MIPNAWRELLDAIRSRHQNAYYMPVTLLLAIRFLERRPGGVQPDQPIPFNTLELWFAEAMQEYDAQPSSTPHYPVFALQNKGAWVIDPAVTRKPTSSGPLRDHHVVFCQAMRPGLLDGGSRNAIREQLQGMIATATAAGD